MGSTPAPLMENERWHKDVQTCIFIVKSSLQTRKYLMSCQQCLNMASDGRWAIICNPEDQK